MRTYYLIKGITNIVCAGLLLWIGRVDYLWAVIISVVLFVSQFAYSSMEDSGDIPVNLKSKAYRTCAAAIIIIATLYVFNTNRSQSSIASMFLIIIAESYFLVADLIGRKSTNNVNDNNE